MHVSVVTQAVDFRCQESPKNRTNGANHSHCLLGELTRVGVLSIQEELGSRILGVVVQFTSLVGKIVA